MAEKAGVASAEKGTPTTLEKAREDEAEVVSVELPAPAGWMKKFMLNEDGSPRRNEIVFISPTGEEIKNKRQLQQYLKYNPGGPPSSEFDWGTGDTPRRSARIRERAKAVETPEDEKPKKRERKSSSKKAAKHKKDDGDAVDETSEPKEDATTEEAKAPADAEMKEAEDTDEVKDKADATGTAVGEGIISEVAANEVTDVKAVNEGSGEQDPNKEGTAAKAAIEGEGAGAKDNPILGNNRSVQEKTDASLENAKPGDKHEESTTGQENQEGEAPLRNGIRKEDPDATVPKGVPSVNCSDGQHLPKASPVNC